MTNAAAARLADPVDPAGPRGVIYTRRWVVAMMLDLAGYTPTNDLTNIRLVEPACGDGAFLAPIIERLIRSAADHGRPLADAGPAIRAYDIDPIAIARARVQAQRLLRAAGVTEGTARALTHDWIVEQDYLLPGPDADAADLVVGNPPYVRLEHIPEATSTEYRARWVSMSGRADLYIGFLNAALESLRPNGAVAYICPDRWMRNQYGRQIREIVAERFNLDVSITLHDADPFQSPVAAYPAVVLVRRGPARGTLTVEATNQFRAPQARSIVTIYRRGPAPVPTNAAFTTAWVASPTQGKDSWATGSPTELQAVQHLEANFPALGSPDTSTRVGVGVATGADDVYITSDPNLVEPERLLPLVFSQETTTGHIASQGRFLVNPWDEDGKLVDLDEYPRLRDYYEDNKTVLQGRHVARKNPQRWFRTIDRVDPALAQRPKLLLPDLKSRVHPVLDPGGLYPQHNLFFVIADDRWDIEVLGGLLLSDVATMLVEAYSVKMANGFLRVTAQYLRRIRIPDPDDIAPRQWNELRTAFRQRDIASASATARKVYGLTSILGD